VEGVGLGVGRGLGCWDGVEVDLPLVGCGRMGLVSIGLPGE
jgi:hypothetical protein